MSARYGEWELLGRDGDPAPGDPAAVGEEARHLAQVARTISAQVSRLSGLARPDAALRGFYADELVESMKQVAEELETMRGRFEAVGLQLTLLEPAIQTARTRTKSALDDAVDAQARINANRPGDPPTPGAPPPTQAEKDDETARSSAHRQGVEALADARTACDNAMKDFNDVADSVAGKIMAAAADDLEDSFWDKLLSLIDVDVPTPVKDPYAPPPLGTPSADLKALLDLARQAGVDPSLYADLLQQYYVTKAAEKAGIDLTTWDVSQGAEAVSEHYERTYAYYAQLYLDNPDFRWAGMAAMIGPSFAAGFEDIEFFQTMARDLANTLGPIPDPLLPFPVSQLDEVAGMGAEELQFYQTTFLQMQKDIFYDASMMHEAYLEGGMASIEELREAGLLGTDTQQSDQAYNAWQKIDTAGKTGDIELLNQGNEDLLYREQFYTIADQYQDMKNHAPTGEVMTYMMGLVGQPSIPGTHTLGEVDNPIVVPIDTMPLVPGVQGGDVTLNIPQSNIADFDARWGLIKDDTLPVYLDLLKNDPDQVEDILNQDVRERIDEMRLADRWPDLLDSLVDADVRLW